MFPLDSTGRYFMTEWSDNSDVLAVFDTSSQSYVYKGRWKAEDSDHKMSYVRLAGDWKISFESNKRCRVLDIRTMKISCVVQGQAPQYSSECYVVNEGKELATMSRGRMNIKLVDIQTGKILSILKAGQKKRLDTLVTNKTGTKLAADCEGPILVFDVTKRCLELEITPQMVDLKEELYLSDAAISADGVYMFFTAEYKIPKEKLEQGVKSASITTIYVFDIVNKKLQHRLCDVEDHNKLGQGPASDLTVSTDGFHILDDTRLVSTHDDFVVRVWGVECGTLLQRLRGHISYVRASVCPGSSILVTNGNWDEEYTIRLWDTTTWQCIAMYRYEYDINDVQLLNANSTTLICRLKQSLQPLMFTLKGQGSENIQSKSSSNVSATPALTLTGTVEIDSSHPDDDTIDEDNPDSDPEEVDSDDDDDDDDDLDSEEQLSDDEDWLKTDK
ncbi:WD repeat protein [Elysia marginata]|uniref:WD repeat protein n=1 Tax=Elysia marginata TaxID=1093978 RepID=A0AAV4JL09_9GAST|nr:WD repeat protein [Elysia marginata]